jgi:hypothetical protein
MLYHPEEDWHGDNFTKEADNLDWWINGEAVDGQHVVVWYCSHLFHELPGPADEWHGAGPDLVPFLWDAPRLGLGYRVPGADHCHSVTLSDTLSVTASVSGIQPFAPNVTYHWAVAGGTPSGPLDVVTHPTGVGSDGLIRDSSKLVITGIGPDVTITCEVQIDGVVLFRTLKVSPLPPDQAAQLEKICVLLGKLKTIMVRNPLINPFGPDDRIDLGILLTAPGGIVELNRIARDLQQVTQSSPAVRSARSIASQLLAASGKLLGD